MYKCPLGLSKYYIFCHYITTFTAVNAGLVHVLECFLSTCSGHYRPAELKYCSYSSVSAGSRFTESKSEDEAFQSDSRTARPLCSQSSGCRALCRFFCCVAASPPLRRRRAAAASVCTWPSEAERTPPA